MSLKLGLQKFFVQNRKSWISSCTSCKYYLLHRKYSSNFEATNPFLWDEDEEYMDDSEQEFFEAPETLPTKEESTSTIKKKLVSKVEDVFVERIIHSRITELHQQIQQQKKLKQPTQSISLSIFAMKKEMEELNRFLYVENIPKKCIDFMLEEEGRNLSPHVYKAVPHDIPLSLILAVQQRKHQIEEDYRQYILQKREERKRAMNSKPLISQVDLNPNRVFLIHDKQTQQQELFKYKPEKGDNEWREKKQEHTHLTYFLVYAARCNIIS